MRHSPYLGRPLREPHEVVSNIIRHGHLDHTTLRAARNLGLDLYSLLAERWDVDRDTAKRRCYTRGISDDD